MHHRGAFADPADDEISIDTAQQTLQIWIVSRIVAHDGVLYAGADAIIQQARHGIQARFSVVAEGCFVLEIQDQFRVRRLRNLAIPSFESSGVARVATGQDHRAREAITPQQLGLFNCQTIVWPKTGYDPEIIAEI